MINLKQTQEEKNADKKTKPKSLQDIANGAW